MMNLSTFCWYYFFIFTLNSEMQDVARTQFQFQIFHDTKFNLAVLFVKSKLNS